MSASARPPLAIADVRTYVVDAGFRRTFLFVVVEAEDGLVGVGEASQNNQDLAVASVVERRFRPALLGADAFDAIEQHTRVIADDRAGRATVCAFSAVEMALWDLQGRAVDLPVASLLGGASIDGLRCYATMAVGLSDWSPEGLATEAQRCLDEGFAGVKVVPFPELRNNRGIAGREEREHLRRGVDRVRAVRDAIGDAALMVELQLQYDRHDTIAIAKEVAAFDPFWIEAPLRFDEPTELCRLRDAVDVRIASGECLHGRRAFRELLTRGAVDVVQPDPKWTGGVLEAKKVAAWAEAVHISVALHNNSGPVSTAAAAHLSVTLPNAVFVELPSRQSEEALALTAESVLPHRRVERAALRGQCGLGVEFDEERARALDIRTGGG